uniref:Protein tyrosine phosphatase domain-containing protein 1 n=2 Tax=Callorhinchus milii TaxID=7868 RepID=A0A4W3IET9_CALMI|eukprot:gi/632970330/ref/XP_007901588.1/ PREDICTED: protein tyrosine phosphatase domain-containing protein 1 [Callorhinchus milii]
MRRPTAKYTKVGERLRHVIPSHMQCSMACGGRACKYENPSRWSEEEQAVKGLYSSWITDNILGMARPSSEIIEKYNIIEQFKRHGVKTVINLQRPGEHASCGNPLEQESGFTYLPEVFMEAGNYFYNFGWKDYGVASLTTILDMVKVVAFALQEGRVAIHCHAGLGRTGVLVACYLVFATRMSADQAILFVRAKRPNAIQTRGQLLCVREFAQFLTPLRNVFACSDPRAHPVTIGQYLIRQRHLLHGYEARQLKYVPKIVHLVCKLLLDFAENKQVIEEEIVDIPDLSAEIEKTVSQLAIIQLDQELDGRRFDMDDQSAAQFVADDSVLVSEQEFHPLWKHRNEDSLRSLSHVKKRLCYSESDLHKAELFLDQSETPPTAVPRGPFPNNLSQHSLPQLNLRHLGAVSVNRAAMRVPELCLIKHSPSVISKSSFWEQQRSSCKNEEGAGSPLFLRRKLPKDVQRKLSLKSSTTAAALKSLIRETPKMISVPSPGAREIGKEELDATTACSSRTEDNVQHNLFSFSLYRGPGDRAPGKTHSKMFHIGEEEATSNWLLEDIPCIMIHSELSVERRRSVAAKALAFCTDFDREVKDKVEMWQRELNSREGTWERICSEKNPYVLSSLMWSWLEQLKEPVISKDDVDALARKYMDPCNAFYSLEKSQHQTLTCILDCVANLHELLFDVENAILTRAIRAFTKVSFDAIEGPIVYNTLKTILKPILEAKQVKLTNSEEQSNCLEHLTLQTD